MLPLENYSLKLYGGGKLISLERNKTKTFGGYDANIKGWSPLIRNDDGEITAMSIILHMPLKNPNATGEDRWGELEIIRK